MPNQLFRIHSLEVPSDAASGDVLFGINITFVPLNRSHLGLMFEWFNRPHMKEWWGRGRGRSFEEVETKYGPRADGKVNVFGYIIQMDGKHVGYIQYYPLTDFLPDGVVRDCNRLLSAFSREEMAGVDVFIGEESLAGKRYGTAAIRAFLDEIVFSKYRVAVIDPQVTNKRAIGAYEKCGFTKVPYSEDPGVLLMTKVRGS